VSEQVEPSTWEAFWRTAVEAQPVDAVARDLAMSTGAVYIARSRVMRRLRVTVERHEHARTTGSGNHD
jgi:RNA polymerase sigma-70 factor (ECF subfamily)